MSSPVTSVVARLAERVDHMGAVLSDRRTVGGVDAHRNPRGTELCQVREKHGIPSVRTSSAVTAWKASGLPATRLVLLTSVVEAPWSTSNR